MGRGWAGSVWEGLGSGTGVKGSRKKVFLFLRQLNEGLNSHVRWGRAEWFWDRAGLGSCCLCLSPEWSPTFSPGEMQGEGRKWIGSSGTGSLWLQPSGPDNSALGDSRQEPWPKGAVGQPEEAVGGERLQQGPWKRQAPAKHYFQSVLSGRICSGTIYFPIVTALAEGVSIAGPKLCSGVRFLIRKSIWEEFLNFCYCLSTSWWSPC